MVIPPEIQLSHEAFEWLSRLVYDQSRICLGDDKRILLASRLTQRLRDLGLGSFEDYCDRLAAPDGVDEVTELIDLVSTNHTRFFREPIHFEILRRLLPELASRAARDGRSLSLWSAAAASGEEAYSMAIVLAESAGERSGVGWRIEASDISRRMLERCRMGIYELSKVHLPTAVWRARYFLRGFGEREGMARVKPALRRRLTVRQVNLFQDFYPVPLDQDVIFCRNVMIYFDQPSRVALVERLTAQLAPGGYLFVGHTESLIGIPHALESCGPSVYRRPG
ncbi:MAG: CheR family methyltransferase [Pirellulales bacterium]|jgi:chemotaxis protein methyltransferase CheR